MKKLTLIAALAFVPAVSMAQTLDIASDVKFSLVAKPVTSTSTTANPQNQFYHATYTGAAWGDVNNDGFPDLFYSDRNTYISNSTVQVNLYYNNGDGTFRRGGKGKLAGTTFSAPVWLDYDNDGTLDLFVAGLANYDYKWLHENTNFAHIAAHLYRNTGVNNGAAAFQEISESGIRPIFNGKSGGKAHNWVAVADYDNDGYADLLMQGFDEAARLESDEQEEAVRAVYLYRNTGDGRFELQTSPLNGVAPFHGLTDGTVVMEDLDNDGCVDILTTGYGSTRTSEIHIYWNNGDGTFAEHDGYLKPVKDASSTIADLNGDGLADLIISGYYEPTNTKCFYICKNLGGREFEMLPLDSFEGADGTQIAAADVNSDGLADILVGGHMAQHEHSTVLYVNRGDFKFEVYGAHFNDPMGKLGSFSRVTHGAHHLVDVDRDGYVDAWFSGWSAGGCSKGCTTELWKNDGASKGQQANKAPEAPSNLKASVADGKIHFSWTAPADDTTPAAALRYNVYLRSNQSGKIYSVLPADLESGYIKVSDTHGAIRRCEYAMSVPADGNYTWGVQAIDASNEGGPFATSTIELDGVAAAENDIELIDIQGGNATIKITAPSQADVEVYNVSGMLMTARSISAAATITAVPGIYIVKVTTELSTRTRKITVL